MSEREGEGYQGYQGWKNYPTWAAYTWLTNSPQLYQQAEGIVDDAGDMYIGGDELARLVEAHSPLAGEATLYADLLGWAIQAVDWSEIALWFAPADWEPPQHPRQS